jgi:hypothetical protein
MRCVCDRIHMNSSSTTMYKEPIERRYWGSTFCVKNLKKMAGFRAKNRL